MAGEVLSRQKPAELVGPMGHVRDVVRRRADVVNVAEKQALLDRVAHQFLQVRRRVQAPRRAEVAVHVVREVEHAAILGPDVEIGVVLRVGSVVVARPAERRERERPEPLVDVDVLVDPRVELRAGQAEDLGVLDQPIVVVGFEIRLIQEIPAVRLLVVAEVADPGPGDRIGVRQLESRGRPGVGGRRVVDQFVLEQAAFVAVVELALQEHVVVVRHDEFGRARVRRVGRDHFDQVGVNADEVAGVVDRLVDQGLSLTDAFLLRAVDGHGSVYAEEQLIGLEADAESQPPGHGPSPLAPLQPHADVVEHLRFVVDHGGPEPVVAHHVRGRVQQARCRRAS